MKFPKLAIYPHFDELVIVVVAVGTNPYSAGNNFMVDGFLSMVPSLHHA